jgi:hypothetical protein
VPLDNAVDTTWKKWALLERLEVALPFPRPFKTYLAFTTVISCSAVVVVVVVVCVVGSWT